jgi:hypothetical protein
MIYKSYGTRALTSRENVVYTFKQIHCVLLTLLQLLHSPLVRDWQPSTSFIAQNCRTHLVRVTSTAIFLSFYSEVLLPGLGETNFLVLHCRCLLHC